MGGGQDTWKWWERGITLFEIASFDSWAICQLVINKFYFFKHHSIMLLIVMCIISTNLGSMTLHDYLVPLSLY